MVQFIFLNMSAIFYDKTVKINQANLSIMTLLSHFIREKSISPLPGFFVGQGFSLQYLLSSFKELSALHSVPPLSGAGLLHTRDRVWFPPPHFAEQLLHFPHLDHFPLTRINQ